MKLKTGARFKSSVCSMEGIVIRQPAADGALTCGGQPIHLAGDVAPDFTALAATEGGAALVGKRYVDEQSGIEVLCTRGGKGALAFDDRVLLLKTAKPMPSSD